MNEEQTADNGSGSDGAAVAPATAQPNAITTVDQLKALADPIRLSIVETLMRDSKEPPVMSVKELAAALGEPQTKLYRHVRQLEAAGLIKVAATRLVSGIAEQRYQASQQDLNLADGLLHQHMDEAEAILRAVFDRFRRGYFASFRASEPPVDDSSSGWKLEKNNGLMFGSGRRSPAQVAEMKAKLQDALAAFHGEDSDAPDAVEMNLLVGYFSAAPDRQD